jgi:hypothetical protein
MTFSQDSSFPSGGNNAPRIAPPKTDDDCSIHPIADESIGDSRSSLSYERRTYHRCYRSPAEGNSRPDSPNGASESLGLVGGFTCDICGPANPVRSGVGLDRHGPLDKDDSSNAVRNATTDPESRHDQASSSHDTPSNLAPRSTSSENKSPQNTYYTAKNRFSESHDAAQKAERAASEQGANNESIESKWTVWESTIQEAKDAASKLREECQDERTQAYLVCFERNIARMEGEMKDLRSLSWS